MPGIFEWMADQAGFEMEVALATRNAASLRGHILNTADPDCELRGNIARRKWDIVVPQEQSDATLPKGRGGNGIDPWSLGASEQAAADLASRAASPALRAEDHRARHAP